MFTKPFECMTKRCEANNRPSFFLCFNLVSMKLTLNMLSKIPRQNLAALRYTASILLTFVLV